MSDNLFYRGSYNDIDVQRALLIKNTPIVTLSNPQGYKGQLKGFQQKGIAYMYTAKRCGLFDVCGTGKTHHVMGLACLLKSRGELGRALYLVPGADILAKQDEFALYTSLNFGTAVGTLAQRVDLYNSWADLLIVSYEVARLRDFEYLNQMEFDTIFLDESHVFKNHEAKTAQVVKMLCRGASRVYTLSATPIQLSLMDVHSQSEAWHNGNLDPSILDAKAPLASPNFTGVPTAPTAPNGTNTDQIATTKFVQNALSVGDYGDMMTEVYDTNEDGKVNSADTADKLSTARNINGVAFDGSSNITIEDNTKVDKDGDTMTGKLVLPASTTSSASINIPHGSAPSSLVNGDMWTTTSAPYIRINNKTRVIYHSGNADTAALSTVSQVDAEAGSSTTVRAWTALRVRQAIEAVSPYYAGITPPSNTKKIWIDTN